MSNNDKFLNTNGVTKLWNKVCELFVTKETGKGLSTNDFTNEYKNDISTLKASVNGLTEALGAAESELTELLGTTLVDDDNVGL